MYELNEWQRELLHEPYVRSDGVVQPRMFYDNQHNFGWQQFQQQREGKRKIKEREVE